jgi:hypothetical protein
MDRLRQESDNTFHNNICWFDLLVVEVLCHTNSIERFFWSKDERGERWQHLCKKTT